MLCPWAARPLRGAPKQLALASFNSSWAAPRPAAPVGERLLARQVDLLAANGLLPAAAGRRAVGKGPARIH